MIASFGNRATSDLYQGISNARVRQFPSQFMESTLYKLDMLNAAQSLDDLRSPPGNRLEALIGDLKGFYSIRVNAQWRILFRWQNSNAYEVRLMDYH